MLKKKIFDDTEIPIFDQAIVYQRGEYWQFRMYLAAEKKYIVKALHTLAKKRAALAREYSVTRQTIYNILAA